MIKQHALSAALAAILLVVTAAPAFAGSFDRESPSSNIENVAPSASEAPKPEVKAKLQEFNQENLSTNIDVSAPPASEAPKPEVKAKLKEFNREMPSSEVVNGK